MVVGVVEMIRYVLFQSKKRDPEETPLLMRFAHRKTNPAMLALQFFSSLLAMEHEALFLLAGSTGHPNLADFMRLQPEQVHLIRTVLMQVSVIVSVRFIRKFSRWPWKLATCANFAAEMSVRVAVAVAFFQACWTCLDLGCFAASCEDKLVKPPTFLLTSGKRPSTYGHGASTARTIAWSWGLRVSGTATHH